MLSADSPESEKISDTQVKAPRKKIEVTIYGNPNKMKEASNSEIAVQAEGANTQMQEFLKNHPIESRQSSSNKSEQLHWQKNAAHNEESSKRIQEEFNRNQQSKNHALFNPSFWEKHRYTPPYFDESSNWKTAPTVGTLSGWLGWHNRPVYYGYVNGGWSSSPDAGMSQTAQSTDTTTTQPTNSQWLPMGVFALIEHKRDTRHPHLFLQVALNKDGTVAGTLYDAAHNKIHPINGLVDSESQRIVWKPSDDAKAPIAETGIFNFTQTEIPVRIHNPNGQAHEMLLIRLI